MTSGKYNDLIPPSVNTPIAPSSSSPLAPKNEVLPEPPVPPKYPQSNGVDEARASAAREKEADALKQLDQALSAVPADEGASPGGQTTIVSQRQLPKAYAQPDPDMPKFPVVKLGDMKGLARDTERLGKYLQKLGL